MIQTKFPLLLLCYIWIFSINISAATIKSVTLLQVHIYDAENQITAARVRFTDVKGKQYAPEGYLADFSITSTNDPHSQEAGLILDEGRKFYYSNGSFNIDLPKERIIIEVVKGFRYQIYQDTIDFSKPVPMLNIHLKSLYEYPEKNWYSGDVHVHYIDPETALLQMKSEDLNVCNVLISDFTVDHDRFRGTIEPLSEPEHIVYFGQEFREDRLGHINLLNIKSKLIEPAAEPRKYHYPLNIDASDEVHRDGGHVSWAHFAAWPGLEGPLGLVLKKIDAVELLCTIDPFQTPIFAAEVVPELPMNSGLRLWYRLLNCGLNIPATAGTDKMNNQVSVGANRVFAQIDEVFNYASWIQAINEGKTFITNNPFLKMEIEEQGPGSIIKQSSERKNTITAEVWTQFPIDRLEIIANGELIAEKQLKQNDKYAKLEIEFQPEKSTWITARAYEYSQPYSRNGLSLAQRRNQENGNTGLNRYFGTLRPETVFAHTSPIYIIVDEIPVRSSVDASYFVRYLENSKKWLGDSGNFPSEELKQQVLDAFQEGIEAFTKLGIE
ncbi:MAG: CehA/McbA family metallohydrolase [Saprospiraceae bacterium]|nr:CehA/McbA family metallohydrolase [Saprospiraceae bacterium]